MNLHILEYALFLFQRFDNLDFMVYNSYCRSIIAEKTADFDNGLNIGFDKDLRLLFPL